MADRYIDFNSSTGTLTGTWTFTNGSASVTAAGDGDAVNELANGDYIKSSHVTNGIQWYKVTARPDADTITITPVFQQATHTDGVGASLYNSEAGSATVGVSDFCHHHQATTDEVRSAGDIIRTRGGLTYTYAGIDIIFDEDGTVNNYIELKGIYTAAGDDSWGDGNVAQPIIDFDSTAFGVFFSGDRYWKITGHEIVNSSDPIGALRFNNANAFVVDDCYIHGSSVSGILINSCDGEILNCDFDDNTGASIHVTASHSFVRGCTFNGGGGGTQYGINAITGCVLMIADSTFGVTTEHSVGDIRFSDEAIQIYGRNVILDSATPVVLLTAAGRLAPFCRIEDYGQVQGAYHGFEYAGDVTTDTGESPPSGAGFAFLGEPNTNSGSEQALNCAGDWFWGFPIYLDGTEQTITVKIKALDADWSLGGGTGGRPDNSELFVELDYHNGATTRTTAVSTEACTDDTYTVHTITVTPDAAGPAYLKVKLLLYEAGGKIYVDPGALIAGGVDVSQVIISAHGMDAAYEIAAGRRSRARYHGV